MTELINFILHIDQHLVTIVNNFGGWTYLILFLMVFIETGVVIFPFLPGDSLLFAASALAANTVYNLNIWVLFAIFLVAAVLGDTVNYEIGKHLGLAASNSSRFGRLINRDKLAQAEAFFNKHGGKTIAIARFMPLIRTFAPFVSGGSNMDYKKFIHYNFLGGFLWVTMCCVAGFFFGNQPFVKSHFSVVVLGIIAISLIPVLITAFRKKKPDATAE
ncbi:VTT domain-containing protein [Lacticaseibacillus saniviri]|uniref:Membrane-associated protein n=1 Tax=Lacticaseibacillus saniviri JCM 17471 = DSM 24301 TaxID=1293598 RepID=A0A0R2MUX8_9LACO|nr:VTT domain-containing protein [Lacticaseibacillus saniviri]KRO17209.1 membrane-associated protein [Lacticaseibacillus saniviri JCM 17471 = DSM 24301]MCG4282157.1 VTT domain-containing protein [Lacticaseibacillus saniviri]